jgi:hypothetical protein
MSASAAQNTLLTILLPSRAFRAATEKQGLLLADRKAFKHSHLLEQGVGGLVVEVKYISTTEAL